MPPRHSKSETTTKYFPAWYLGRFPERRVIVTSYEAEFAASWGRKVRELVAENSALLGIEIDPTLARSNNWKLKDHEGGMMTAGVGGPLTGYGADLLIFDDPVKNSEQAASPTYREKTWEWWQSTAYTRLMPGGSVVGIMTRWHEDDLIGRILKQSTEHWEVLNLAAVAEEDDPMGRQPGEALWPEQFPVEVLDRIKATVGSYYWSAMYMGRPTPRDGGFFKNDWFHIIDGLPEIRPPEPPAPPSGLRIRPANPVVQKPEVYTSVRAWDLAATEDGDWTVGTLIARHRDHFFIVDVVRERFTPDARDKLIRKTAERDGVAVRQWFEQEPGSAGVTVANHLRKLLAGYVANSERSTGSKEVRAEALAAALEGGSVDLVRGTWNARFIEEMLQFPNGKHDDQVDATSLAFNKLASLRKLVAY